MSLFSLCIAAVAPEAIDRTDIRYKAANHNEQLRPLFQGRLNSVRAGGQ